MLGSNLRRPGCNAMRAFLNSLWRRDNFRNLWRVLRREGPVAAVQRSLAWVGRLWALYGRGRNPAQSPFALQQFWTDMAQAKAFSTSQAPAVLMRKASYGNGSVRGARTRAVLMSVYRTLKTRGVDPLAEVRKALETYSITGILPDLTIGSSS